MKEPIFEYYPNGDLKAKFFYRSDEVKHCEMFYDEDGYWHREGNLPDYQEWHENGMLWRKSFYVHGKGDNLNNPADISFYKNGRIEYKEYILTGRHFSSKLQWHNYIKNI